MVKGGRSFSSADAWYESGAESDGCRALIAHNCKSIPPSEIVLL